MREVALDDDRLDRRKALVKLQPVARHGYLVARDEHVDDGRADMDGAAGVRATVANIVMSSNVLKKDSASPSGPPYFIVE